VPMETTEPTDHVEQSPSSFVRFLGTGDLDELLALRQEIGDEPATGRDARAIATVLDGWTDVQALANLLMHPSLIPAERRHSELMRGLDDVETPYIRIAAVIGVGDLQLGATTDVERHRFVHTLLDLIRSEDNLCADRGSFSLVWLMRQPDAPDVIECLAHPSDRVRHNIVQGLLEQLGSSGLKALLTEPGFVDPQVQAAGLAAVHDAGIDLDVAADDQLRPLILTYVPNLEDYEPDGRL
jgi:hypothetical protein